MRFDPLLVFFIYQLFPYTHQWTQLKTRKQNLTRLFQKMQAYQFEQISADPDKPLADGIRPLDTADMERYISCIFDLTKDRGVVGMGFCCKFPL